MNAVAAAASADTASVQSRVSAEEWQTRVDLAAADDPQGCKLPRA